MGSDIVLEALGSSAYRGLSDREAAARRRASGPNEVWQVRHTPSWRLALDAVFDPALILLLVTAVVLAVFEYGKECGVILGVVLLSAFIRGMIAARAGRILEDVTRERIPIVTVIRDGEARLLHAEELVTGDIVCLEAGDTVPCDGRVLSVEDACVSERGITENQTMVHKYDTVIRPETTDTEVPTEFRSNMLFAGSSVVKGPIRMAATACGDDTLVVRRQGKIKVEPGDRPPVLEKLKNRSRTVSLVMLGCVLILTVLSFLSGKSGSLVDVFTGAAALAAAAMSEFFASIGTVMLSVTVREAAARKEGDRTVILRPDRLDRLASPDVVVFCDPDLFKSCETEWMSCHAGTSAREAGEEEVASFFAYALTAVGGRREQTVAQTSARDALSLVCARTLDAYEAWHRLTGVSAGEYEVADHKSGLEGMDLAVFLNGGDHWVVCAGPLETVLGHCRSGEDGFDAVRRAAAHCEKAGEELLAVCVRPALYPYLTRLPVMLRDMRFVGFISVREKAADGAGEAVAAMREDGIRPILFSRDPNSDLSYLRHLGLFDEDTPVRRADSLSEEEAGRLNGAGLVVSLDGTGPGELGSSAARTVGLIRRALPEAEVLAVGREAWEAGAVAQASSGVAAVSSDVSPIPGPLTARSVCAVYPASGGRGRRRGGVVGLLSAVEGARQTILNLRSVQLYLLTAQTARLVTVLAGILLPVPLLSPAFILVWGLLFDLGCVIAAAFERSRRPGRSLSPLPSGREAAGCVAHGVLWGTLLALLCVLIPLSVDPAAEDGLRGILSAGALLSGLAVSDGFRRRERIGAGAPVNRASVLFALLATVSALLVLFVSPVSGLIGAAPSGAAGLLAAVPALVLFAAGEVRRVLRQRGEEGKK